jgi:hypothetical protein
MSNKGNAREGKGFQYKERKKMMEMQGKVYV